MLTIYFKVSYIFYLFANLPMLILNLWFFFTFCFIFQIFRIFSFKNLFFETTNIHEEYIHQRKR